jgi:uncharacterized protein (DUF849 family)
MEDLVITAACDGGRTWPTVVGVAARRSGALLAEEAEALSAGAAVLRRPATSVPRDDHLDALVEHDFACLAPDAAHVRATELRPPLASVAVEPVDVRTSAGEERVATLRREHVLGTVRVLGDAGAAIVGETYTTGGAWTLDLLVREGVLPPPPRATIVLGKPGGTWSPPTIDALELRVRSLPPGTVWSVAVCDPDAAWRILPTAIAHGGHVRVGWEDNPYLPSGEVAGSNGELVALVADTARRLGRPLATPARARRILGCAEA